MVWPNCDGWPSGPFRAPTSRWEMLHPKKLTPSYQHARGSVKMSKYECQIVGTSLLQHVNMETPGVLWCSIICLCFKNFRVLGHRRGRTSK